MIATLEKKGTNDGVLKFTIAQDGIQRRLTTAFSKVKKNLDVPGFRKKKISRQVFNRTYDGEALYEDALNTVLLRAYEAAVKGTDVDPVSQPEIDAESMEKDQDWVIIAEVTVKPGVKLGQYKDLVVEKQDREITNADVDTHVKREQGAQAELVIKEDAAAENNDTVVIDFKGFVDDEVLDGRKSEDYSLELGLGLFILGFEDQLIGHKSGESLDINTTFPEDYQAGGLAREETVLKVTIHGVRAKEMPELDDEFTKDIGGGVPALDELEEKCRKELIETKEKTADDARDKAAIHMTVESAKTVELPHVMVHDGVRRSMDEFLNSVQRQDISPEVYYQLAGSTEEDLHKQFESEAEMCTRTNLVTEAVAAARNLQATEEEINTETRELSETYGMPIERIKRVLTEDMLEHDMTMKKAIELIAGTATETKE